MKKRKILWIVVGCLLVLFIALFLVLLPRTGATKDTTAPTVSSTINANGATNVPINTKVGAFFSEAMNSSTLTAATFTFKQGTTPVAGTVTGIGVAAVFTPAANLAPNTEYTATITTGAKDFAGNALVSPYIWSWTTGVTPDTTPPTVSSTIPTNGATGVAANAAIPVVFSEAMDPLTLTTTTFTLKQGTTPVTGAVTYIGVTATFAPSAKLAPNTEYTATITTGAKDLADNALASNYVWTFRIASGAAASDTTPPIVGSTIPANGATGVAVNSAMSATFSEAMNPLTLTTTTFTLQQGTTPVAGAVTYAVTTATFKPAVNLTPNTVYTATITTGVKDLAGNALFSNKVWTFTAGAAPDTTAPTVSSTVPVNAATGVAINSSMSATFSEAMDPLTVTTATFTLTQGTTPVTGAVTYAGVTVTFDPDVDLTANIVYTATITTGAKDLAGNAMASNYVWTFTPGSSGGGGGGGGGGDTTSPTVTINQASGQADPTGNSTINYTVVFSESVSDFATGDVTISGTAGGPKTATVTGSGTTYNVAVTGMTTAGTVIADIAAGKAQDAAGNANTVSTGTDNTVTYNGPPDTTPPTVSSTTPSANATGVDISSDISAVFSEEMIAGTFTPVTFTLQQGVTSVNGTVNYAGFTATFNPTGNLIASTNYTATITTAVTDLAGLPLAVNKVWTFRTAAGIAANPTAPNLGEAGRFVLLAYSAITNDPAPKSLVYNGDIGITPAARTFITGFTPSGSTGNFTQLTGGTSYAPADANPAPFPYPLKYATAVIGQPWATTGAMLTKASTDMGVAYDFLAFDPNPTSATQSCPADLGGLTLTRGVYKTAVNVIIPTALHLSGSATDVFIFSIDGNLTTGATGNIFLDGGVLAKNVYWRVAGKTTIAAGTNFYGNVISWQQINVLAGTNIVGRLFSVTEQVTLISDNITKAP